MQTLSAKKYNQHQMQKWQEACIKARAENRSFNCMPQLAFYISEKQTGYWAFNDNTALWGKTKAEAISRYTEHTNRQKSLNS